MTKKCPDCAEEIQAEAHACRFCGWRYDPEGSTAEIAKRAARAEARKAVDLERAQRSFSDENRRPRLEWFCTSLAQIIIALFFLLVIIPRACSVKGF